jgi:hypothetical protein
VRRAGRSRRVSGLPRQAQVISILRPPGIGIAANFDRRLKTGRTSTKCLESEGSRRQTPHRPKSSCWRRRCVSPVWAGLVGTMGITKATPAPQARRLAPDRAYPSVSSMSWPFWVVLQRRTPYPEQRWRGARLGSTRNDRHVSSVPDLCARRSDRLLAGQSAKVIPAASYRHAPLDVARPQPDVVPAEWPHAAAHSESRP